MQVLKMYIKTYADCTKDAAMLLDYARKCMDMGKQQDCMFFKTEAQGRLNTAKQADEHIKKCVADLPETPHSREAAVHYAWKECHAGTIAKLEYELMHMM